MKTVYKIARTELRILFYSPIAWFLMIVFLIQCGVTYTASLQTYVKMQETGGMMLQYMSNLTEKIFTSPTGLFASIMQKLYLFIPLLTMGLISRESSSGTIKLLYSSPVKVRTIIMGKFLAMMIYDLLLLVIISIFMMLGMKNIVHAQGGIMLSAALGFYLVLCAYSAIGLFMSCLTTYQVVAAVSTFVMIGILSYIGTLWQSIDFVRDLTYFLSIAGRTEKMLAGLITSKDILYFILIVGIFLGLSMLKLNGERESTPVSLKAGQYVALIATALLIGYVSSQPGLIGYYDATTNKSRTLTPNAQAIIKELGEEPLEVHTYVNLLDNFHYLGAPEARNRDLARWEPYMRFKHNIKLNYVMYYDSAFDAKQMGKMYPGKSLQQVAEKYAKASDRDLADYKTPKEIRKMVNLHSESNRYVMQLKYKGRTTFLRVFDDMMVWPSETEVGAAIKRLLQAKLPKIGFLTGDYERDINSRGDREFKAITNLNTFRYSLVNQGFDVDTVSLETRELPADISALVIADPKMNLQPTTIARLQQFIDCGGNLLIAGEPNKQALLNNVIQPLGVQFMDGMVVQESKDNAPDIVTLTASAFAGTFTKALAGDLKDSLFVRMPGTVALSWNQSGPYTVHPLLTTDSLHTWNKAQKFDLEMVTGARSEASRETPVPNGRPGRATVGTIGFAPEDGDVRGVLTTAVALTRPVNGKEQRIVILGDADCMSNGELKKNYPRTANFSFNTALFSWLTYGDFPINTSRPNPQDNRVTVSGDSLKTLKLVLLWILPALLVAAGALLLIRRKRK